MCLVVLILGFVLVAVCLGGLVVLGFVLPHSGLVICGLFLLVAGFFICIASIGGWVWWQGYAKGKERKEKKIYLNEIELKY